MRPYMSCLPTDWFEQDKCGVQVNLKTKVEFPGLLRQLEIQHHTAGGESRDNSEKQTQSNNKQYIQIY